MKNLATLILISFPILCNAQTIHFEDRTSPYCLYRNYDNVVTIVPSAGMNLNELKITCVNCLMERDMYISDDRIVYNLTPEKNFREAQLQIHDKNGLLLKQEDFKVSNLPDFELYIGLKRNGETVDKTNLKLSIGYPEEVTLKCQGEIRSWQIEIDSVFFAGQDQNFSEEAMSAIIAADSSQTIRMTCTIVDRDGIQRHRKFEFKVG